MKVSGENKQYAYKELIRRFAPYYKNYKGVFALDLFCAALTTVCELVLPMIMRYITNEGIQDLANLTIRTMVMLAGIYMVLRLIDCVATYYMLDMGHVMGAKIETDMRKDAYTHLQKLSDTFYSNTKVGQIMGRITNDLFDVTEFAHHCPEEFFIAGIKFVVSFVILSQINIWLTLIVFAITPMMLLSNRHSRKKSRIAFKKQRVQIGDLNARIEDSLLGQKVVKAFANEEMEIERFEKDNRRFLAVKEETYKYMARFHVSVRLFDGIMYVCVLLFGGMFLVNGQINAGDLIAYLLYVTTLITTVRKIIDFTEQFQRGMTGIERFIQIMDADVEIFDEPCAKPIHDLKGDIQIKDVEFEYPDDKNQVFKNLNMHILPGEKVAIVGPSGGGKSTLCNLIPRFYNLTSGEIRIDDKNIKNITLKSLRSHIGIVQQDVYLFSGTVYENILYGRLDATEEEAIAAAKAAGADEFIVKLKDGYHTYVGERGVKLSGGQKQRISIARVFLKDPKIIILDEATSALDNESEYAVARSLDRLSVGRTTITIAHRLSTIQKSDRIFVLSEQGIEEEGNHEELLQREGTYHKFYQMAMNLK